MCIRDRFLIGSTLRYMLVYIHAGVYSVTQAKGLSWTLQRKLVRHTCTRHSTVAMHGACYRASVPHLYGVTYLTCEWQQNTQIKVLARCSHTECRAVAGCDSKSVPMQAAACSLPSYQPLQTTIHPYRCGKLQSPRCYFKSTVFYPVMTPIWH